jgi:hypothetical protein
MFEQNIIQPTTAAGCELACKKRGSRIEGRKWRQLPRRHRNAATFYSQARCHERLLMSRQPATTKCYHYKPVSTTQPYPEMPWTYVHLLTVDSPVQRTEACYPASICRTWHRRSLFTAKTCSCHQRVASCAANRCSTGNAGGAEYRTQPAPNCAWSATWDIVIWSVLPR